MFKALKPEQIERTITSTDGKQILLFHTGWSPFSNFHGSVFMIDGQRYTSVEQYYQAQKAKYFNDVDTVIAILKTRSPRRCKEIAKDVANFDQSEWALVAEKYMLNGVKEKFLQNAFLRKLLVDTGAMVLAEATQYDNFWATGLNISDDVHVDVNAWPGRNVLGQMLMSVRDMIPK